MKNLSLGDTARVTFSLTAAPDATPTVKAYAGSTLLGNATVTALDGTNNYQATYTLPGSGITDGTEIEFRADADVSSAAVATLHMIAGVVGVYAAVIAGQETIKGSGFDSATDTLEGIRDATGGSAAGDRNVNLTVSNDSAEVVPGAKVSIQTSAGVSIAGKNGTANASGVVSIALSDGDYKALVTSSGYQHTAEAFSVDEDNEAVALTVTATAVAGSGVGWLG